MIADRTAYDVQLQTVDWNNRGQREYLGWAKKSKPDIFCNNFVYCWPIFIIFDTYTL